MFTSRHMFFLCAESHLWILPPNGYHGNVVGGRKCKSNIVAIRTYDVKRRSFLPKPRTEFSLPLLSEQVISPFAFCLQLHAATREGANSYKICNMGLQVYFMFDWIISFFVSLLLLIHIICTSILSLHTHTQSQTHTRSCMTVYGCKSTCM